MKTLWRRSRLFFTVFFCVLTASALASAFVLTHLASEELLRPERRDLHEWHKEYLAHQDEHSLAVSSFEVTTSDRITLDACFIRLADNPGAGDRFQAMRKRLRRSGVVPLDRENGTIVWLHGKNSIKENSFPIAERFVAAGFNFVCFDARGHGQSGGRFTTYGPKECHDVADVLDAVETEFGDAEPLRPYAAFGNSLGAAIVVQSLPREPRLQAGVAVSPFADLDSISRDFVARYAPVPVGVAPRYLALRYAGWRGGFEPRFANPRRLAGLIDVPIMIVHGENDRVIPAHHGRDVFDAVPHDEKIWREIAGAGHNPLGSGGDELYAEIIEFIWKSLHEPPINRFATAN